MIYLAFTSDQIKAIETRGGSVMVSAAAGSGKTAVLTQRIITYLKNGGSLDRLLVVTFTNLAATEMKERIKTALEKENLTEQLMLINSAKITTMDAFYSKILKENILDTSLNPNFLLLDEARNKILKKEAISKVFEENFNEIFANNFFDIKKISVGEEIIISFSEFLNKIPFNDNYIAFMMNNFDKCFDDTIWAEFLYNELLNNINSFIDIYEEKLELAINDFELSSKLAPFLKEELDLISNIKENILKKEFLMIKKSLQFEFLRLPSIKGAGEHPLMLEVKEIRAIFKDEVKKYRLLFENENLESVMKKQKELLLIMLDLTEKYRVELKKLKGDYLTFDDISSSVLNLVIKSYDYSSDTLIKTPLAEEITLEFDEILIDEYQDTNMMQDLIFRAISSDNLFTVGDVKQSIYGFRGSEPEIMVKKKEAYLSSSFPMLITLSKNFRSRFEILDFTNFIFKNIMSKSFGAIDYNEDEFLYLGASYKEDLSNKVFVSVINKETSEELDLESDLKEANLVASQIKKLVDAGENPSDIAILIRDANSRAEKYRNALNNAGVSVYTATTKRYFDQYEVKLIIALLKVIEKNDKISLVAVLRSPLYGFSEDFILQNIDNLVLPDYDLLLEKSSNMPLNLFVSFIYTHLDVINKISLMERGEERIKNLLEMLKHASNFESDNLSDFVSYLDLLVENDLTLEGANPAPSSSSVLITSIHKSKGLQFKHVFMPELSKKFNKNDLKEELLFDKDLFISFKVRNEVDFLSKEAIKTNKMQKLLEEEMRILYVGLTRACEFLYLSFTVSNFYDRCEKVLNLTNKSINYLYLKNANSYMDFILPVILRSKNSKEIVENTKAYYKFDLVTPEFNIDVININDIVVFKNVNATEKKLNTIKETKLITDRVIAKSTVTSLKVSKKIPSIIKNNNALNKGIMYHKILEDIPFINYSFNEFKDYLISINSDVSAQKLFSFFDSSIYKEIINSNIYKEYEISFVVDDVLYDGVIDLLCEFDDKYYIIDYKSDVTDLDSLKSLYKVQLDMYEKALNTKKVVKKFIYSIHNENFIEI